MTAGVRALVSVLMLIGFYVLALVELAASVALAIWLLSVAPAAVAIKVTLPLFVAIIGGVGWALWQAIKADTEPMPGVTLTPEQAPQLWAEVRRLADGVGTRAPDEIRIVPEVNAAVQEQAKLLGLIAGHRYLYLGLPLLQAMSVDQLRAVLAHELGHYSGAHTRLGAVAYRGRIAIAGAVGRIGKFNVAGWPFYLYAQMYLLVDNAASRRQELEADASAVRLAGRRAAIAALTEVHVVAKAYDFYLGRYVAPGAALGLLPDNVFGRFTDLLDARRDEIADLRRRAVAEPEPGSRWDTHPPLHTRIAAIEALPEGTPSNDLRRATDLVPNLPEVSHRLHGMAVNVRGREVLPWERFTAVTADRQLQEAADGIFREVARRLGVARVGLAEVLSALAAGRASELGRAFFADVPEREAAQKFAEPLELLLMLAAVRSERYRWRESWASGPVLVTSAGADLDLAPVAKLAVDPDTLPQAQERLRELGIEATAAVVQETTANARNAEVIAGLGNVTFGGVEADLLVLDNGLIAVPTKGDKDEGTQRMLAMISSTPLAELAQAHRFVPYEEITKVTVTKQVPIRATIQLHSGQTIELRESWSGDELHGESRDVLHRVFARFTGA
ncbi:M48 family metallopeptidase [Catellatospora tritici]|uniref:M48 family metallopeptidase n=1 Tax=Catellatospora tritici TaxID=2851566 RepID=UPI001C2D5CFD|nr:M48 family metallopeptidase [Catellatospora tritici]MBV1852083.1 M48 family metalloprotease [Catellatospora tritici]